MELFTVVEDAAAIVSMPKGVHKQTKVYQRRGRVYIPHAGGFVRICAKMGDRFVTSHPDIKVIELEGDGIETGRSEPCFVQPLRAAA